MSNGRLKIKRKDIKAQYTMTQFKVPVHHNFFLTILQIYVNFTCDMTNYQLEITPINV
jgi:hypothetical protein